MSERIEAISREFHTVLMAKLGDDVVHFALDVDDQCGFEALRLLCEDRNPKTKGKKLDLRKSIQDYRFSKLASFEAELQVLRRMIKQYRANTGKSIEDDDIQLAFLRSAPIEVREDLILNAESFKKWEEMALYITKYIQNHARGDNADTVKKQFQLKTTPAASSPSTTSTATP